MLDRDRLAPLQVARPGKRDRRELFSWKSLEKPVRGETQVVLETKMHPAQLRDMVTTPAGTTIAAIAALEHSGLRAALIDAVERATARARELA